MIGALSGEQHIDIYTLDWSGPAPFRTVRQDFRYECPYIRSGGYCQHSYVTHTARHAEGECEQHRPAPKNQWRRYYRKLDGSSEIRYGEEHPWPEFESAT